MTEQTQNSQDASPELYEIDFNYSWKGTTNANTIEAWKAANVDVETVSTTLDDGTIKKTHYRPDMEVTIELPTIDSLINQDKGRALLSKLVERTAYNYLQPFMDKNDVENLESPTADQLLKFVSEPVKQSKLKATKEEMEAAARVFADFLTQIGKKGNAVEIQKSLFTGKMLASKVDKFADEYFRRGAEKDKVLEIVDAVMDNLQKFQDTLAGSDEETREACEVPTLICIQNLENWKESTKEADPEEVLDVDDF